MKIVGSWSAWASVFGAQGELMWDTLWKPNMALENPQFTSIDLE
jgi:hypothetical protein